MDIEISIIIPVYNVEDYIEQCLNSILCQLDNDMEIILVNDGSEDKSVEKCSKFLNQKVRIINQKNLGLSAARNTGIRNSKGKYILFIDSDDFIGRNSIVDIKNIIKESKYADLIFLQGINYYEKDNVEEGFGVGFEREYIKDKSKDEVIKYISKLPKFPGSACTKLIKRNVIIENNIFFEEGVTNEDLEWSLKVMINSESFDYCKTPYYYYRQNRKGSITESFSYKKFICLFDFIKKWTKINYNSEYYKFKNSIYSFLAYEYNILLAKYAKLSFEDKKKISTEVKNYSWLMNYRKDPKNVLIKNIFSIFGLEITSKLINLYIKIR